MKVSIDETGQMLIESETPLEAYALKKWCDDECGVDGDSFPNILFTYGVPEKKGEGI